MSERPISAVIGRNRSRGRALARQERREREAERRRMLEALLRREDLLSSRDWPWTTEQLYNAYARLRAERCSITGGYDDS